MTERNNVEFQDPGDNVLRQIPLPPLPAIHL